MAYSVVCPPCGHVISAKTEPELIDAAKAHARTHGHEITSEMILKAAKNSDEPERTARTS